MREDWSMETTVLLISLAIIPVLLAMAILCLRIHKTSKSNPDLFGTVGTVKSKETDESFTSAGSGQDKLNVSGEERGEVRTPSYDRKLPELPSDEQYKGKEDSSSELYATVDEMPNNNNSVRMPGQRTGGVSLVPESHHPYAQVKKQRRQEHPYAKVGEVGAPPGQEDDEEEDTEEYDTADHLQLPPAPAPPGVPTAGSGRGRGTWVPPPSTEGRGTWVPPPTTEGRSAWVPPPRRPEENRPRGSSRQTTPLPPEPGPEIHFSGDSQDSFSAKGYTSISVREPLANLSRPPLAVEGNYVTLSETSDEMYAAIEETVYTHPGGAAGGAEGGGDMYSKVDKAKKRGKSLGPEERPAYATVNKGALGEQGEGVLGARPKQRSPCPPHPPSEGVDYSEYEVAHSDSRAHMNRSYHKSYPSSRDPGYETVPYSESGISEKEPGYEMVPQGRGKSLGSRDPEYETLASETRDPGYETLAARDRVNSLDPGYETVPQKRREPGYASLLERDQGRRLDPGYETVSGAQRTGGGGTYSPRSFPTGDYESVQPREPGYETLEEGRRREDNYRSLEPGYEELPEVRRDLKDLEVQYSRVNKKATRAAPPHRSPPRPRLYSGSEVNYETLPEPKTGGRGGGASDEGGYETIPASERLQYETMPPSERLQYETMPPSERLQYETMPPSERLQYDPGYETLPAMRLPPSEPGYETIPGSGVRVDSLASEGTTDPDYARLKDADIEFIDDSADELDDELGRLQTDEDVTVESSQSSSLIHMSVVESGHGVRRSSVVVIEHVDMTPVPSRASEGGSETDMDVNTHIFV